MSLGTIKEYKEAFENKLPPIEDVVDRNKKISSIYAELYLQNKELFKWAGMAAFASNHVGIGLTPYHIKGFKPKSLTESHTSKSLIHDFNLLRHINNEIYDDIAWTHQAYLDGGIPLLEELMGEHAHYKSMLDGWKSLEAAAQGDHGSEEDKNMHVWRANAKLLRHEQEIVVQPLFNKFSSLFRRIITICASLDFNPNHFKTDYKYHSSFIFYVYTKEFHLLKETKFLPDLTRFNQRWNWLERKVVRNWIKSEKYDDKLKSKVHVIYDHKGC